MNPVLLANRLGQNSKNKNHFIKLWRYYVTKSRNKYWYDNGNSDGGEGIG
jgi:hypothetical protein